VRPGSIGSSLSTRWTTGPCVSLISRPPGHVLPEGALAPHLLGDLDDEPQLRLLLLRREVVALERRREPALRREAELLDVRELRGLVDSPRDGVLVLELAVLRRHEPENDLLVAPRQQAQRFEPARPFVVPLHEEAVDLELAEQRLRD